MKRLLVVLAAAVAALAIAASASAHTGAIAITCQGVTFTYTAFPASSSTESHEIAAVDGTTVYDDTFLFSGNSAQHVVPLTITGDVVVTASFDFTSSDGFTHQGSDEAALSCGEPTTGGATTGGTTTGGTTTGGTTTGGTTTGGTTTGGTTTGGTATGGTATGGTATGGTTTGGTATGGTATGGTATGGTTVGETTGTGGVSSETSGGTTGGTTGGTSSAGGNLPFTGLPIWLPVLAGGLLIGVGYRLLKRRARSGA
jgi:hypothetical protein